MLPLSFAQGAWQVTGLTTEPDFTLASARFQVFLVNGRVVVDRILGAVLREVYAGLLPRGRHPGAVVSLTVPPEAVDVNVHPAKTEIRFHEPGKVYARLQTALRQGLGQLYGESPGYRVTWQPEAPPRAAETQAAGLFPRVAPGAGIGPAPGAGGRRFFPGGESAALPSPGAHPGPRGWRFQDLEVLGTLARTYILAQGPDGLVLIDQHAAHERVLYEALKAKGPAAAAQTLLFPRVVEVTPSQAEWVKAHLDQLAQAGLTLEPFGGASFMITAAPAALAHADLEAVVAEAVEALAPSQKLHPAPGGAGAGPPGHGLPGGGQGRGGPGPRGHLCPAGPVGRDSRLLPLPPRAAPVAPHELPGHPPELSPVKDWGKRRKGKKT